MWKQFYYKLFACLHYLFRKKVVLSNIHHNETINYTILYNIIVPIIYYMK